METTANQAADITSISRARNDKDTDFNRTGSILNVHNITRMPSIRVNHLLDDTYSMDSGFASTSNLSPMQSKYASKVDLRSHFNELVLMPNFELEENIQDLSSMFNMPSVQVTNVIANNSIVQLEIYNGQSMMPFFYQWSKNSLNRVRDSMSKFLFISKIKESILNTSSGIMSICESVEKKQKLAFQNKQHAIEHVTDYKNSKTSTLLHTVKLFTISNCKIFNQYFLGIYDVNYF